MHTKPNVPSHSIDSSTPVTCFGIPGVKGGYLLRIQVAHPCNITFGRRSHDHMTTVQNGVYLYLGSAMAARGSASLPYRVMRHATRSGQRVPHRIRVELSEYFLNSKLILDRIDEMKRKKLFWHIDYLLDREEVELTHVVLLFTRKSIEQDIYELLCVFEELEVFKRGLGASDTKHDTHLWKVNETDGFWLKISRKLEEYYACVPT